jgi:hypothetical protein
MDQSIYHDGPVTVWLSPASGNVTSYDGSGEWAKIWELGAQISSGSIKFPAAGQSQFNFQIPACTRTYWLVRQDDQGGRKLISRTLQPLVTISSALSRSVSIKPVRRTVLKSTFPVRRFR